MNHPYSSFIDRVAKPARYLGGEHNAVAVDPAAADARIVLAFPDVYEIGMSHMGTKILYTLLNRHPKIAAERCFAPWLDLEAELRARELPLVSLESSSPLGEFDVIGMSLQYDLTFTNVLTMLDLGGVALRSAQRADSDPLVLAGGPCATHPEPMADFFDAFFVGEAEEQICDLVLAWSQMRRAGRPRAEALAELAGRFSIYVPSLYETETDVDSGMTVVVGPLRAGVPARVMRGVVAKIDDYPFPSDAPVPFAEAVFDRAGVEIARGCTEGCRFCQAGMIYRPVRERSPQAIVDTVVAGVDGGGYDETSLTSLSTADYSCITPLIGKVMDALRDRNVSLSVSSLRAYGLGEDTLDAMTEMRISGLTFAPEAGSQRLRDLVNKNITEEHLEQSARQVFERGWEKLKLYFMIGLPTEEDEDVLAIADVARRTLAIGRAHVRRRADITVSVSTHVPKPHTPFQWCAQDGIEEVARKQKLLRSAITQRGLSLRVHDRGVSYVEGVISRGDRRLGAAIELAWRRGARFDSWAEQFDLERWRSAFADSGVDADAYLQARPLGARLPWDHIDVGLKEDFLRVEYRRALQGRASPPCGKPVGQLVHHTNLRDAEADDRLLVCYHCGADCDLEAMAGERRQFLTTLGALEPVQRPAGAEPKKAVERPSREGGWKPPVPRVAGPERPTRRFRIRYAKRGRAAFLGHLDTVRVLARLFRRGRIDVGYTRGFHPKPHMQFSPALALGVQSLGELLDVAVETPLGADALLERLRRVAPPGFDFEDCWELAGPARGLSKLIEAFELAIRPVADAGPLDGVQLADRVAAFSAADSVQVERGDKSIDVRAYVDEISVVAGKEAAAIGEPLLWPSGTELVVARIRVTPTGTARPREVAVALGLDASASELARLAFVGAELDAPAARGRAVASR